MTDNPYQAPRTDILSSGDGGDGVSRAVIDSLVGTRPWVSLIGTMLLLACAFMFLAGLGLMGMGAVSMGVVYLLMTGFYLFPAIKLRAYSRGIRALGRSGHARDLEDALEAQRGFWKFAGMLALLMIVTWITLAILAGAGYITLPQDGTGFPA